MQGSLVLVTRPLVSQWGVDHAPLGAFLHDQIAYEDSPINMNRW